MRIEGLVGVGPAGSEQYECASGGCVELRWDRLRLETRAAPAAQVLTRVTRWGTAVVDVP